VVRKVKKWYDTIMTEQAREILHAALGLSLEDRALVATEILASMDDPGEDPEEVESAWAREIDARMARAKAGATTFSEWTDIDARLRRKHLDG